jgi:hypothetical protein
LLIFPFSKYVLGKDITKRAIKANVFETCPLALCNSPSVFKLFSQKRLAEMGVSGNLYHHLPLLYEEWMEAMKYVVMNIK